MNGDAVMHNPETWVLLADASRAKVVRIPRHMAGAPREAIETVLEFGAEHRQLREIMADEPGRSYASTGKRRSAIEYHSDPVREQTRAFARTIVSELEERFAQADFERLVVCAPARMLGALREARSEALADVTFKEIEKDYTKLPQVDLRNIVEDLTSSSY
jgi:protein required for attachment to host cells